MGQAPRMRTKRQYAAWMRFILFVTLGIPGASSIAATAPDYQRGAVMLYNLAKFIEWPSGAFDDPATPFGICVFGRDPFGSALDVVSGRQVRGRRIETRKITTSQQLEGCHIAFVDAPARQQVRRMLGTLRARPLLTVGTHEGFASDGGMIELEVTEAKVHFHINMVQAKRVGLKISAHLLQLADVVE